MFTSKSLVQQPTSKIFPRYLMSAGQVKKGKQMLEDSINLSKIAGLKRAEQCARINLVNSDEGECSKAVRINDECGICKKCFVRVVL
jgi:hypothetical protein